MASSSRVSSGPVAAKRRYYERNRQKVIERSSRWACANPDARREATAKYRERNREEINRRNRDRSKSPQERAKKAAYRRDWRERNPAANKLAIWRSNHRDRGSRRGDSTHYVDVLLGDPCSYCGAAGGETDHIVAVVNGGDSTPDNLTAACRSCNARKHKKSLLAFLLDRT